MTNPSIPSSPVSYPKEGHRLCASVEDSSYWFAHRNRAIVAIAKRFPPCGPVLDIGGGNGVVSRALNAAGLETWLLEPGDDGVATALARGAPRVFHGQLEGVDLAPGTLGGAGLFDVLEHIKEPVPFLHRIRTLLAADAPLYLTVPAFSWLWSSDDVEAGHFRRYAPTTLEHELVQAGFAIEFVSHLFAIVLVPLFLMKVLPDRLRIPRKSAMETCSRDHCLPGGLPGRIVSGSLSLELERIAARRAVPVGTSLLCVARRRG
jgi:hypothetical protein